MPFIARPSQQHPSLPPWAITLGNEVLSPQRRPILLASLTLLFALASLTTHNALFRPTHKPIPLPPSSALHHAAAPIHAQLDSHTFKSSFFDKNYMTWAGESSQFETLFPPSEIDFTIPRRLPYDEQTKCDDILLFLPYGFARHGHGSQLNNYLLAVMIATFLGKAMVILEVPQEDSTIPNGSQFGCPIDGFQDVELFFERIEQGRQHKFLEMKEGFPQGLGRLIQHPDWLSRKCPVPCRSEFKTYSQWDDVRKMKTNKNPKITCTNDDNERETNVIVLGGEEGRKYFFRQFRPRMVARDPNDPMFVPGLAYNWATRLGAKPHEAQVFASLNEEEEIWDFVSALLSRSGLIRFQPWIVRDVAEFIKTSELPLEESYDGIHVRRGDKLNIEAVGEVTAYWLSQGYKEGDKFPTNYIPFAHYLKQFDESDCEWGEGFADKTPRTVYVATDDPGMVKKEISNLPQGRNGANIVAGCQNVKFIFNPAVEEATQFHLSDGGVVGDCFERYTRNIQAIADLMIMIRSERFVGEYNSNWGRLVRIFRVYFNDGLRAEIGGEQSNIMVKDFRVAFGQKIPAPPGW